MQSYKCLKNQRGSEKNCIKLNLNVFFPSLGKLKRSLTNIPFMIGNPGDEVAHMEDVINVRHHLRLIL